MLGYLTLVSHPPQGKAQPYDSKVLTPIGWTCFGKLCVGDEVIGSNGMATQVTGVYPRGKRQTYRVEFDDGYGVEVSDDHLWRVQDVQSHQFLTLSTKHLLHLMSESNEKHSLRWRIPIVRPVTYDCSSTVDLPVDPYFLGLFMSCGCLKGDEILLKLSHHNAQEITTKLSSLFASYQIEADSCVRISFLEGFTSVKNLLEAIRQHDLLPESYLRSSITQRVHFIQGIFDLLGTVPAAADPISCVGFSWGIQTTASVIEMIQSLGGIATLQGPHCLIASFPSDICPFALKEKEFQYQQYFEQAKVPTRRIKSIQSCRCTDVLCISVEAGDHLYVTEHFIVTHNTIQVGVASSALSLMFRRSHCSHIWQHIVDSGDLTSSSSPPAV
jgi:hypothetical protein